MARIRTIKPEFPQSESMGRVSRDARLLFIQLWTLCDDSGITRAASRMLASLLFPYDDDAPKLIDGWLCELEGQGCIARYEAEGAAYIIVQKWAEHQRIDKPSPSKFPQFVEASRTFAKPRERSCEDQGPRTKEGTKDQGMDSATQTEKVPSVETAQNGTPLDLKKELFSRGVTFLKTCGLQEKDARTALGKWRRDHGEVATLMAIATAEGAAVSEPIPYIQAILRNAKNGRHNGKATISDHPLGIFAEIGDELDQAATGPRNPDHAKPIN